MNRITFIQPSYAHYRNQLFKLLSNTYNIHFIYERDSNTYPGSEKPRDIDFSFLNQKPIIKWFTLVKHLVKDNPEIVITSISMAFRTMLAYIYSKLFRKKFILWMIQWKEPTYPKLSIKGFLGRIRNQIAKYIILNADALVVGGTASRNYALSLGKSKNEIFTALQCSNDISIRENNIVKSIAIKKYKFLYLSRIINWKGLDILIKAFYRLEKERDDVQLIIGGDGPFKNHCQKLANLLNVKKIEFLGSIDSDKTYEVFSNSDIFVLPSYNINNSYEAWGLVINEAMSMNLPIITTNAVGASYDMINQNGFVVDNGDEYALYLAMNKILDCDIRQMGEQSRKIFEEKNNYTLMAHGFIASINHVRAFG